MSTPRKRHRVALATSGAAMLIALSTLTACHAFYTVRGVVRSCANQQPIPDAAVTLRYPGEWGTTKTTADGAFSVAANDPPGTNDAELEVSAAGFATAQRTVHHSYDESQGVCLQPAPQSAP